MTPRQTLIIKFVKRKKSPVTMTEVKKYLGDKYHTQTSTSLERLTATGFLVKEGRVFKVSTALCKHCDGKGLR